MILVFQLVLMQIMKGSASLNNSLTWDDPAYLIPIEFDFQYFGSTINEIVMDDFAQQRF